jgi:hypothetical protein
MKTRIAFATALVALAASSGAQEIDPQCPPGALKPDGKPDNTMVSQDACQKAIDLFKYMGPQLGLVLAGGNPTQGVPGTLGGPGHFSIGIRGNGLNASLPEIDRVVPNTRGAQVSNYTLHTLPLGFATADVALGVFEGIRTSGLGAVDLLVSASFIPSYDNGSVDVAVPDGHFKIGFGAKVGVLRESATRPGISVSYLNRATPSVTITGTSGDDELLLEDVRVRSKSWRGVIGKNVGFFGLAAGYGRDSYDSRGSITVTVAPRAATDGGVGGPIALGQKLDRNNFFGSFWIRSQVMRLVGEVGRVSGGTIETYNTFTGVQPADARTYFSLGISFGR